MVVDSLKALDPKRPIREADITTSAEHAPQSRTGSLFRSCEGRDERGGRCNGSAAKLRHLMDNLARPPALRPDCALIPACWPPHTGWTCSSREIDVPQFGACSRPAARPRGCAGERIRAAHAARGT